MRWHCRQWRWVFVSWRAIAARSRVEHVIDSTLLVTILLELCSALLEFSIRKSFFPATSAPLLDAAEGQQEEQHGTEADGASDDSYLSSLWKSIPAT